MQQQSIQGQVFCPVQVLWHMAKNWRDTTKKGSKKKKNFSSSEINVLLNTHRIE